MSPIPGPPPSLWAEFAAKAQVHFAAFVREAWNAVVDRIWQYSGDLSTTMLPRILLSLVVAFLAAIVVFKVANLSIALLVAVVKSLWAMAVAYSFMLLVVLLALLAFRFFDEDGMELLTDLIRPNAPLQLRKR